MTDRSTDRQICHNNIALCMLLPDKNQDTHTTSGHVGEWSIIAHPRSEAPPLFLATPVKRPQMKCLMRSHIGEVAKQSRK